MFGIQSPQTQDSIWKASDVAVKEFTKGMKDKDHVLEHTARRQQVPSQPGPALLRGR